jgi:hypothetical protein
MAIMEYYEDEAVLGVRSYRRRIIYTCIWSYPL